MPILDLTTINNRNTIEITNLVTNTQVEVNGSLIVPNGLQHALEDHTNVASGATVGQIIVWDGTNWTPTDNSGGIDISATTGQILQYDGAEWVAVDSTTISGSGSLSADINVTDGAGNISPGDVLTAGTTFEDIFNTMLVSFQNPVASLSDWTTGTFEHGATFTEDGYTLAFTNDSNINTGIAGGYSISDTYIGSASGSATAVDGPYTIPTYNGTLLVTNTSAGVSTLERTGAASMTVNGFEDTQGGSINTVSASSTVRFRYWIIESTSALTPDAIGGTMQGVLAGADSSLNGTGSDVLESGLFSSDSQLGFTAAGGHDYIFWVFPAAAEIANVVMNGSINLYGGDKADKTTAVIHMGEFDMTNQFGQTVRMEVLRTKVSNAFAAASAITVS